MDPMLCLSSNWGTDANLISTVAVPVYTLSISVGRTDSLQILSLLSFKFWSFWGVIVIKISMCFSNSNRFTLYVSHCRWSLITFCVFIGHLDTVFCYFSRQFVEEGFIFLQMRINYLYILNASLLAVKCVANTFCYNVAYFSTSLMMYFGEWKFLILTWSILSLSGMHAVWILFKMFYYLAIIIIFCYHLQNIILSFTF